MTTERKYMLLDKRDGVATITINRPEKRNALSRDAIREIMATLDELKDDDTVRVVVTTAAGDTAYTAGRDLTNFLEQDEYEKQHRGTPRDWGPTAWELSEVIRNYPKVTLAAINGYCLGAGIYLVIAHDLAVASEEKAQFGLPEVLRGMASKPGGVLFRAVPKKWAYEMCLTGRNWDAKRAFASGLINRIVPHAQLQAAAHEWAAEIAQLDAMTLRYIKQAGLRSMEQTSHVLANEVFCLINDQVTTMRKQMGVREKPLRDFVEGKGVKANK